MPVVKWAMGVELGCSVASLSRLLGFTVHLADKWVSFELGQVSPSQSEPIPIDWLNRYLETELYVDFTC